ncbi:MAG: 30S ribosomal protein S5 [candidate division WOR-3 bacterium]|uniref:Small ribosomal subunit protein uS5 n=1 Tax=candidate division WOR-3 bacterium TaxID=2052148 RepID=A0A7C4VZG7_UNCW3
MAQEYIERVIEIKRVAKTTKGGKRLRISAVAVVGDGKSMVGVGHGKAVEVAQAVRKAIERAKKEMVKISIKERTIPHEVTGKYCSSKILLKPASPGTGIIACQQVRAVLEALGLKDVLTKSFGSRNPLNLARATIKALKQLRTLEEIARARNKPISYFVEKKHEEDKSKVS